MQRHGVTPCPELHGHFGLIYFFKHIFKSLAIAYGDIFFCESLLMRSQCRFPVRTKSALARYAKLSITFWIQCNCSALRHTKLLITQLITTLLHFIPL